VLASLAITGDLRQRVFPLKHGLVTFRPYPFTMSVGFYTKSHVFDPRPAYPLVSTVKRYWKPDSPYLNDPEALTLVFAHGTGFHKEHWEPVIDDLQAILGKGAKTRIREIWSIDCPNHGDAAHLNEDALKFGLQHVCGCPVIL